MLRLIYFILFLSLNVQAAELNKIYYDSTKDCNYAVTFVLEGEVNYQVISANDEVIIDFIKTKFEVKDLAEKLDSHFIKNIRRIEDDSDNLRIALKLANNVILINNYSVPQNQKSFVAFVFKNEEEDLKLNTGIQNAKETKKFIIMIDPGHGGIDKGTVSSNLHILEKNLTLAYAKELQKELSKYPQYQVYLTRNSDIFMSPEKRMQQAKQVKADIFISLHADFHGDPKMHGASIYTLPQEAVTQEVINLIEQKNKDKILKNEVLLKDNEKIADVLLNMVYQDSQNSSINLAKATTNALNKEVDMLKKSHRALELKVLKGIDTPAILIELGYLSNEKEEKELSSIKHRKIFVQALVQGINQYWEENSNFH